MNRSSVFAIALCLLYLALWVVYADPFPSRDALTQVYYPILNTLIAWQEGIRHPLFLLTLFEPTYPAGPWLVALVTAFLGLGSFCLLQPYLIPAASIILLGFLRTGPNHFLILLCLFFNPLYQISLKNFSNHAFLDLALLTSTLLLSQGVYTPKPRLFWPFSLLWFAAIQKHIGLLYVLCILLAFLALRYRYNLFQAKSSDWKRILVAVVFLMLAILSFYQPEFLLVYVKSTIEVHNPQALFLLPILVLAGFGFLYISFCRKTHRSLSLPDVSASLGLFWIALVLILIFAPVYYAHAPHIPWILGCLYLSLLFYLFSHFQAGRPSDFYMLVFLLTFALGFFLYLFMIGRTFSSFTFPLTLLFLCWLQQLSRTKTCAVLGLLIVLSNCMPPASKTGFWSAFLLQEVYNQEHMNPLGWQRSDLRQTKKELSDLLALKTLPLAQSPLFLVAPYIPYHQQVGLQTLESLNEPHPNLINFRDLPVFEAENPQEFRLNPQNPHVMVLLDLLPARSPVNPDQICNSKDSNLDTKQLCLFHQCLASGLFESFDLPERNPKYRVYLKKIEPAREEIRKQRIQALKFRYALYKNPEARRVPAIFAQSTLYFEMKDWPKAYVLAEEACHLYPDHISACEDRNLIRDTLLSAEEKEKISVWAPILRKNLLDQIP